jgi:FKBP-type peptidyl-prolyl cis-trans isomerase 2
MKTIITILVASGAVAVIFFALSADGLSDQRLIEPGTEAAIRFTCWFSTGEIAVTTDENTTQNSSLKKSSVFKERGTYGPFIITSGDTLENNWLAGTRGFEGAVTALIAEAIVGMRVGESRRIRIEPTPGMMHSDTEVLPVAKVWKRPKQISLSPDQYKSQTGFYPEAGQTYYEFPLSYKVAEVTPDRVRIVFDAASGTVILTSFGEAIVKETEKEYEISYLTKTGQLIRVGDMVGVVSNENDSMFKVDFRHPFGGNSLDCQVVVDKLAP